MSRLRFAGLALLVSPLLGGCNSGLAAIFGSASDDEESNAPSTLSAFNVGGSQQSPATIRFRVIDADGDAASVSLYYQVPGGPSQLMTQLGGANNPEAYGGSPGGTEYTVSWDFAAEADLPDDGAYMSGVNVWAQIGGNSSIVLGANASELGLGNDAPIVGRIDTPGSESSGVIPIGLDISDSSNDLVDMRVEWQVVGDSQWQLARPGGEDSTPAYAITGLSAPSDGVSVNFFWDTDVDLPSLERDVQLRFTPLDPTVEGEPFLSSPFRVDNNAAPLLDLDNGLVVFGGTDRVGGIAIPFSVRDAEGDDLRVLFQWRRADQSFPALPSDPAEVFEIQNDPRLRAQYQVCSTRESWTGGRVQPVDSNRVQLPETGTDRIPLSRTQMVGRPIEFMRPSEAPVDLSATWPTNGLTHIVAAVPIGDGLEALVLEEPSSASWRVRRLTLASGELGDDLADGSGLPTALAIDAREQSLFVGTMQAGSWQLHRIDLETNAVTGVATAPVSSPDGLRGIAALSAAEAVASVDDQLVRARFAQAGPVVDVVATGLSQPWGVARDPFDAQSVLVAEHGADRVVTVRLADGQRTDVLLPDPSPAPLDAQLRFPAPRGIAIDRGGERLLVACDDGGVRDLRALNRGSAYDQDGTGYADSTARLICGLPGSMGRAISAASDGLRLVVGDGIDQLLAIGGVQQRRTLTGWDGDTNIAVLDEALHVPLVREQGWRMQVKGIYFGSSSAGMQHSFAWDSRDVPSGGPVLFRAVAFDSEFGVDANTDLEFDVQAGFDARRLDLAQYEYEEFPDVITVDYDTDGDLDIVVRAGLDVQVIEQEGPGRFAAPSSLGLTLGRTNRIPLIIDDLDGDGVLDVAHCAIYRDDNHLPGAEDEQIDVVQRVVEIFYGTAPGTVDPNPVVLTVPGKFRGGLIPFGDFQALDVDADGDLDLVMSKPVFSAAVGYDPRTEGLYVYHRNAPREYAEPELVAEMEDEEIRAVTTSFEFDDFDGDGFMDLVCAQNGVHANGSGKGAITIHYGNARGSFDSPVVIGELVSLSLDSGAARVVELTDLDQDGDLDLVTAHGSGSFSGPGFAIPAGHGRVTVHFQESPRVLSAEPLSLGASPAIDLSRFMAALAVEDLNGDGVLDVMVNSIEGLQIHFAREPGEFLDAPLVHGTETFNNFQRDYSRLQPCDLDGDGDMDVVAVDVTTADVFALMQVGAGVESLSEEPIIMKLDGFTDGAAIVNVGDMDADGDLDLLCANHGFVGNFSNNKLTIFTQIAPRNFVSVPRLLPEADIALAPGPITAADVDFDGENELVAVSVGTNEVMVFDQTAPGLFGDPLILSGPVAPHAPNAVYDSLGSLEVADVDLDGDLDLLSAPNKSNRMVVFEGAGDGSFSTLPSLDQWLQEDVLYMAGSPRCPRAEDLDGDGVRELLFVAGMENVQDLEETKEVEDHPPVSQIIIFEGSGSLQGKDPTINVLEPAGDSDLAITDVDGDGLLDLVTTGAQDPASSFGPRVTRILYGTGGGSYETVEYPIAVSKSAGEYSPQSLELIDWDSDGDLDLVTLTGGNSFFPGSFRVYEQLAPRVFAFQPILSGPTAGTMRISDLDGDGELDLSLAAFDFASGGSSAIYWGNQ